MSERAYVNSTQGWAIPESPVFDQPHLAHYTMHNADLEREIIGLFLAQLPDLFAKLRDGVEWTLYTHTLKGSARAVGAMQIADVASLLETAPPADRPAMLEALEMCISRFMDRAKELYG
jgi:HPt (histidine-containing phosphotransfer) domain-containing protein